MHNQLKDTKQEITKKKGVNNDSQRAHFPEQHDEKGQKMKLRIFIKVLLACLSITRNA